MKLKDQAITELNVLAEELQAEINKARQVSEENREQAIIILNTAQQAYEASRDAIHRSLLRDRSDPAYHNYEDLDELQATMNSLAATIAPLIEQYQEAGEEFFDAEGEQPKLAAEGEGEQLNSESEEITDAESEGEDEQLDAESEEQTDAESEGEGEQLDAESEEITDAESEGEGEQPHAESEEHADAESEEEGEQLHAESDEHADAESEGEDEQPNPESEEHTDTESEEEGEQPHPDRDNIPPQNATATFTTAMADLNRATFTDRASQVKFTNFIRQCNSLPEAQKSEPIVINAMTALFDYIKTLSEPLENCGPEVIEQRIQARVNARVAFEAAIIDLPGHPNEFVQNIGMAFLGIAALITVAVAAAPVLALFSISTAYVIPTASAAAVTGLIGIFTLFGGGSAGAHRQAQGLSTATSNLDEQAEAATTIRQPG